MPVNIAMASRIGAIPVQLRLRLSRFETAETASIEISRFAIRFHTHGFPWLNKQGKLRTIGLQGRAGLDLQSAT
jgi:hypothetical protein